MKKHLLTIGAVAVAVFATQQAAQATLVESGTADLVGGGAGYNPFVVNYSVLFNANNSLFTYVYSFTAYSGAPVTQFTVDASYVNSVLSGSLSSLYTLGLGAGYGSTTTGNYYAAGSDSSSLEWDTFGSQPALETVGYTSYFGPTAGVASANDHTAGGSWNDAAGVVGGTPVPVPVPEASTVMAGALMLLPFGIGAIRSLRKERAV
jgi:hypothetical protein